MFASMMITALMAVTVENLFFTGGLGFSRVMRAARRPREIGVCTLFVTAFSLISAAVGFWLNPRLPVSGKWGFAVRPAVLAFSAAAVYLLAAGLLRGFAPRFYEKNSRILALSAINTAVLAMPYVQKSFNLNLAQAAGFALGTGASFFIASLVLSRAMPLFKNPDMPKAFSGLPAALIYIGILSMAFAGFTGSRVF